MTGRDCSTPSHHQCRLIEREGSRTFYSWSVAIIHHVVVANHSRHFSVMGIFSQVASLRLTLSIPEERLRAIVSMALRHRCDTIFEDISSALKDEATTSIGAIKRRFQRRRHGLRRQPSGSHKILPFPTLSTRITPQSCYGDSKAKAIQSCVQALGYRRRLTR